MKIKKRLIVIFMCLAFLLPSITISSADSLTLFKSSDNMNLTQTSNEKKIYTIYRIGPDGSILPVKVDIELNDDKELGESIADKCEELFEKDKEMQKLIEIELENLTF